MMAFNRFTIFKFSQLKIFKRQLSVVSEPQFIGIKSKYTNDLKFINSENYETIPIYRILSASIKNDYPIKLDQDKLLKMYRDMIRISVMDKILYESQRQGRISFYMTNTGEEAIQIGSASALTLDDIVYGQYREAGVLMWRGYRYPQFINQCYSNCEDPGKGRQMPIHYGSKELNFVTISSPLTTQMPQASGAAYALKLNNRDACVVCYFGEGGASEGDAHPAFNFAATLDCPIIFICRNNGYAISTPANEQYRGDGIAARGPGYGIHTVRVDGNDILAMHHVTKVARDYCITNKKPVLIEAMTYRISHHSTSDDSTAYRSIEEINKWNQYSPILRFREYLNIIGLWDDEKESELQKSTLKEFMTEFAIGEKKSKPHWKELFSDVYQDMPPHIEKQMLTMEEHLKEYGEHYPLNDFQPK
ncbi:GSCOCG00007699001-RA-CDS [Cotesia congregata]|uniref:2-oxoisovalerate dehydrogenase subunit alpha n=1 Tax=Cotesia congregata TaxID=51543 RepID=A0A8J2HMP8_COTCN|nr:GSCOCG00007699001-RA-CDS [Cotesia congregata]CAG5099436.1 Similar to bckd-1A: 2-oxoisovalerate dehydrogenase subunit alpha [Cotesia congregata]